MDWYKFTPVDTLFFRGAEPMNIGEHHTASRVFPPPPQTISGALRTSTLLQQGVSFTAYAQGKAPPELYEAIGRAGEAAPFSVIGPLFMKGAEAYVPAPYCWFTEKHGNLSEGGKVNIARGIPIKSRLLKTESRSLFWAGEAGSEAVSIGGMWIKASDLYAIDDRIEMRSAEAFYENEPRTGIALDPGRKVREHHLYSFNHARLKKEVRLVFGTDRHLPLREKGVLKLGAEQRFGWYERLDRSIIDFKKESDQYLSLSILEGSEEVNASVIATGKILYLGGWDLHKGFHKPMKGFFPAGTVCDHEINNNFIAIKGVGTC